MPARLFQKLDETARRAAERLQSLTGWRRAGAATLSGALAALAMAPFHAFAVLAFSFPALIWLLDGTRNAPHPLRAAGFVGWCFGFGYFLVGLYWVAFSMLVDAGAFAWMIPFAITLFPAGLALFIAAVGAAYARLNIKGAARVLAFAALWSVAEYLRGHVLSGFPWNLIGQTWAGFAPAAQAVAYIGVYGLSLLTVLAACGPALLGNAHRPARRKAIAAATPVLFAAALFAGGALRLAAHPTVYHDEVRLRIVQPNIPQRDKVAPGNWWRNLSTHLALSSAAAPDGRAPTHILWPENAAAIIDEVESAQDLLLDTLDVDGALILGSVRRETAPERFYNALHVMTLSDETVRFTSTYDKHRLVPFGEYVPFAGLLERLGLQALNQAGGLSPGPGPRVLEAPGAPAFAPLVCYESIFPGLLYPKGARPAWLLNVTNDAWFGDTAGPRQHLDQARLRSIETGLPMARAANTGISALIDPYGRYIGRVPLYEQGAIDANLPKAGATTLYTRFGDAVYFALIAIIACAAVLRRR